jgi:hypothetical protein
VAKLECEVVNCSVCGSPHASEALVPFGDDLVCSGCKDNYVQCLYEGVLPPSVSGIWRDGKILVVNQGALFPDFCVKCDIPTGGNQKTLQFPVAQFLPFGKNSTFKVSVGLCPKCLRKHTIGSRLTGLGSLILAVSFLSSLIAPHLPRMSGVWIPLVIIMTVTLLGMVIIGTVYERTLSAKDVTADRARLKGACQEFLARFSRSPVDEVS